MPQKFILKLKLTTVISQIPRFILEAIAFGGIMLIILYIMSITGSFSNAVPLISLYVFAGYRLMPVLQNIYISLNRLSFSQASLDNLYNDIVKLKSNKITKSNKELSFKKEIVLKNVDFSYPNSSKKALKNINLNIPAKSTIGLIGPTGSGKTTVVDVILGLLEVEKAPLRLMKKS